MKKIISFLKTKTGLLVAITGATVAGGLTTAVVMAAIPDSAGTIHGCYRNGGIVPNGSLRIIDSSTSSCNSNETALNWSQGGSYGPMLHDANDQILGQVVDYSSYLGYDDSSYNSTQNALTVYNPNVNRAIPIYADSIEGVGHLAIGERLGPAYEASDCTGQPYLEYPSSDLHHEIYISPKTGLFHWNSEGSTSNVYGIVNDNSAETTITHGSNLYTGGDGIGFCQEADNEAINAYPLSAITLPFTTPIAAPVKF